MNQEFNQAHQAGAGTQVFRLSWVAYIAPVIAWLIRAALLSIVHHWNYPLAVGLQWLNVAWLAYDCWWQHRVLLVIDHDGVWLQRGILPWSRGMVGVKWRDVHEAVYATGFVSWLLRSYRVVVSHRYTRDEELNIAHVKRGHQAVELINAHLMRVA